MIDGELKRKKEQEKIWDFIFNVIFVVSLITTINHPFFNDSKKLLYPESKEPTTTEFRKVEPNLKIYLILFGAYGLTSFILKKQ